MLRMIQETNRLFGASLKSNKCINSKRDRHDQLDKKTFSLGQELVSLELSKFRRTNLERRQVG